MLRFGSQKYHITRGFLCKKNCNKVLGNNFKTILKVKRWSKLPTFTVPYVLGVSLSTTTSVGVQDVSLSTTSSMNVQGVCLHTPSCVDVQGVSFSTFVQFFYAITPDCMASDHSSTRMKKNANAGTSQSCNGMLQYRTEMLNIRMSMPVASA